MFGGSVRKAVRTNVPVLSRRFLSAFRVSGVKVVKNGRWGQSRWLSGVVVGAVGVGAGGVALALQNSQASKFINNDGDLKSEEEAEGTVKVYDGITPFPVVLDHSKYECIDDTYEILGWGVRMVTFMKFKVYCMGIYILEEDKHKVREVLNSTYLSKAFIDTNERISHKQNVFDALNDPSKSMILLENLLDSNIRLLAKITPVRNTSFGHLRDGISNTVSNHPDIAGHEEEVAAGVQEFKDLIQQNYPVAKDDDLLVQLNSDGSLTFSQFARKKKKYIHFGTVKNPIVGKFLFTQYLGGPKPLCQQTKDNVTESIVKLV